MPCPGTLYHQPNMLKWLNESPNGIVHGTIKTTVIPRQQLRINVKYPVITIYVGIFYQLGISLIENKYVGTRVE